MKKEERNHRAKIQWPALFHRAAAIITKFTATKFTATQNNHAPGTQKYHNSK